MSFHVYLEPDLQAKLDSLCKKTGQKRNTLVREAVRQLVERNLDSTWPDAVFAFRADPALVPFESARKEFLNDRDWSFDEPQA